MLPTVCAWPRLESPPVRMSAASEAVLSVARLGIECDLRSPDQGGTCARRTAPLRSWEWRTESAVPEIPPPSPQPRQTTSTSTKLASGRHRIRRICRRRSNCSVIASSIFRAATKLASRCSWPAASSALRRICPRRSRTAAPDAIPRTDSLPELGTRRRSRRRTDRQFRCRRGRQRRQRLKFQTNATGLGAFSRSASASGREHWRHDDAPQSARGCCLLFRNRAPCREFARGSQATRPQDRSRQGRIANPASKCSPPADSARSCWSRIVLFAHGSWLAPHQHRKPRPSKQVWSKEA